MLENNTCPHQLWILCLTDFLYPYIMIIGSVISLAVHMACRLDQRTSVLFKNSIRDARNATILLGHWLLHGLGMIALTHMKSPVRDLLLLVAVPLPTLFYILTSKFSDPAKIHRWRPSSHHFWFKQTNAQQIFFIFVQFGVSTRIFGVFILFPARWPSSGIISYDFSLFQHKQLLEMLWEQWYQLDVYITSIENRIIILFIVFGNAMWSKPLRIKYPDANSVDSFFCLGRANNLVVSQALSCCLHVTKMFGSTDG